MFISEALNSIYHTTRECVWAFRHQNKLYKIINKMAFLLTINLGLEQNTQLTNLQSKLCFVGLSCFIVLFVYLEVMFSLFT